MKRLVCALLVFFATAAGPAALAAPNELSWKDLVPKTSAVSDRNPYNIVERLNGTHARLAGYIVPVELGDGGKGLTRFLLVPYVGACIHVPPPAANQVVFVKTDEPTDVESLSRPVWVEGVLSTKAMANNRGEAAGYTLHLDALSDYNDTLARLPPAAPPVHNSPFVIDR